MTEQNLLSKTLSDTAREARLRAGLSQSDVAERLELHEEVYGRIERGSLLPSIITLRRLSLVLHVPSNELLGIDSAWMPPPPSQRDSSRSRRLLHSVRELGASWLRTLRRLISHVRRRD
ncbi:helix-turn-helix transcriptional regulator [Archangium violaceum]|uniref:helix-turn-helix transcriptional regulator n=1 Tax=Archangium violaceum TaxID=83451 RepID=UPI0005BD3E8E|nr:helix-turn-helix transcriptional regulator [Archangium violaceum]